MAELRFTNPKTGKWWRVEAADEATARQEFDAAREQLGLTPDDQVEVAPFEVIEQTQNGTVFPESPVMAEADAQPAAPIEFDTNFVGPTDEASQRFRDADIWQKIGLLRDAGGASLASGVTMGLGPAAESMLGDGEWDKKLQSSRELTGWGPQMALEFAGGMVNPLNKFMPSAIAKGGKFSGPLKRTVWNATENAGLAAIDEGLRSGGDYSSMGGAALESLTPSLAFSALIESALGTKKWGSKKIGQSGMTPEAKRQEDMYPTVEKWRERAPKGQPEVPNATVLTDLGMEGTATAKAIAPQGHEQFTALQQKAQRTRDEEMDRVRTTVETLAGRKLDAPTAQETRYREERHAVNPEYTPTLQKKFPNASGWINRGTAKAPKNEQVVVPRLFKDELTGKASNYDAWASAVKQGEANANAYALGRPNKEPGQLEVAWQAIRALEGSGKEGDQALADVLKKKLRGFDSKLDELIGKQHSAGMKERAAKHGREIFTQAGKIDSTKMREFRSDPDAWQALQESYLASWLEKEQAGGALPKMTENRRRASVELIGEAQTAALEKRLASEERSRKLRDPLTDESGARSLLDPKDPQTFWRSMLRAGGRLIQGGAGGSMGALGALGPAAAQFVKNPTKYVNDEQAKGLLELFGMTPEAAAKTNSRKRNVGERYGNKPTATLPASRAYFNQTSGEEREERKRRQGER